MIVFDCNLGTDPQWVVVFNLEMIYIVEVVADCLGNNPQGVVFSYGPDLWIVFNLEPD